MSAIVRIVPPSAGVASVLAMQNGSARPLAAIPRCELAEFRHLVVGARERGRRVCALFGRPTNGQLEMIVVLARDDEGLLELARTEIGAAGFPSMTADCPEVHLFERELAEQWGVTPHGHPWLKPVRHPPPHRAVTGDQLTSGPTSFYAIEGGEVHEVAVGPVHAGVIEPGHFRFQCYGENVLHLEISLGYQHRGVERALVGGPDARTIHYAETLAGDTTIGHATAYCQAVEALADISAAARGLALRAIALELERLANHVGDLGALSGDIGFSPTAAFCGRLRGDYLNLTAELCGSRFGRGMVRPGGTRFDLTPDLVESVIIRLERALGETEQAVHLLWDAGSVQSRFEETGRVTRALAGQLGAVGLVARASGLHRDIRTTHPSGYYRFAHVPITTLSSGDVFARAFVRFLEVRRSVEFIKRELRMMPGGRTIVGVPALRPDHVTVSLVEGWRGEICHVAVTDSAGRFATYKVVDPSFHNWMVLAIALRGQQVSDFPLCNKSFNLSYCGHDL